VLVALLCIRQYADVYDSIRRHTLLLSTRACGALDAHIRTEASLKALI
jgi:hypothetical protein